MEPESPLKAAKDQDKRRDVTPRQPSRILHSLICGRKTPQFRPFSAYNLPVAVLLDITIYCPSSLLKVSIACKHAFSFHAPAIAKHDQCSSLFAANSARSVRHMRRPDRQTLQMLIS